MKTILAKDLEEWKDHYRFLTSLVVPRPIAFVSSKNKDGSDNLAPFSFFTVVSAEPPVVLFCPMTSSATGGLKDTAINLVEGKELVVNFIDRSLTEKMNLCSQSFAYGDSEFDHAGIERCASTLVEAVGVKQSLFRLECKVDQVVSYGDHIGAGRAIFARVLAYHFDEAHLSEETLGHIKQWNSVGRLGGSVYSLSQEGSFTLDRPQ